ncbi:hydroxymethylglutaryl-CoA lyase [Reticulibacter mediterranei]|uniref:Hydroxymethylglutaryl-CoA lyase n=1 Tax=Reticulibacter mediterranei TaxID=2778369 RepID=A0A8J3I9N0_9CHLR|nr:hydroxymethylglutaryl-CoA lyase [Reticulibacter mediterranei]GHO90476.1 hydroxymethylglutaryl-CoA lyase [Reticulibacter mediterranei]
MHDNNSPTQMPAHIKVTEVVTRDGFQNEDRVVSTKAKIQVIEGLVQAGITSIEVTSFVHPRVVPQLADADELVTRLPHHLGVVYSALVPNIKGAQRALATGITELHLVLSASESHNLANLNRCVRESLAQLARVCTFVQRENPETVLVGTIATAFHCPFEGRTLVERVIWITEKLVDMGIHTVVLADTDGAAAPLQIEQTLSLVRERFPEIILGLHLHNTRGMGLANAFAGLRSGVTLFESSLGGIGGCPFAPNATGNISTEDLVHMLHEMGFHTGIDLDQLIAEGRKLPAIVGHHLASQVAKVGKSSDLHPFTGTKIASSRASQKEVSGHIH